MLSLTAINNNVQAKMPRTETVIKFIATGSLIGSIITTVACEQGLAAGVCGAIAGGTITCLTLDYLYALHEYLWINRKIYMPEDFCDEHSCKPLPLYDAEGIKCKVWQPAICDPRPAKNRIEKLPCK